MRLLLAALIHHLLELHLIGQLLLTDDWGLVLLLLLLEELLLLLLLKLLNPELDLLLVGLLDEGAR